MNLRFTVDALRLLVEFKLSSDLFPSGRLMRLFCDLLPVDVSSCLYDFITASSYEYFFSGKNGEIPSRNEFREWIGKWGETAQVRRLRIEVGNRKVRKIRKLEEERSSYFVVVDGEIDRESEMYRARKRLIEEVKEEERKNNPEIKRIRISLSEDILKCREKENFKEKKDSPEKEKDKNSAKILSGNNLLSFITRKHERPGEHSRIRIRAEGVFHGPVHTVRHCKEIAKPVRMIFYQVHGEIRPSFYGVKRKKDTSKVKTRNSVKKILAEEDYMYDSEEEWIEGDGESIDKESEESIEEESEDAEWVEKDTNEIFFSKGQLPRIDHPEFTVLTVNEVSAE